MKVPLSDFFGYENSVEPSERARAAKTEWKLVGSASPTGHLGDLLGWLPAVPARSQARISLTL